MKIEKTTKMIDNKLRKQSMAREEFDSFMIDWVEKHEMPKEAYRAISYLMSSYVMNYISD